MLLNQERENVEVDGARSWKGISGTRVEIKDGMG